MWVFFNSDSNSYFLTFFISLMKFCCLCFSETFWFPIMKNKKAVFESYATKNQKNYVKKSLTKCCHFQKHFLQQKCLSTFSVRLIQFTPCQQFFSVYRGNGDIVQPVHSEHMRFLEIKHPLQRGVRYIDFEDYCLNFTSKFVQEDVQLIVFLNIYIIFYSSETLQSL